MLQYVAAHKLGLAVSFVPVDQMATVTEKYYAWCAEAGWQPTPDQIVYRGSISTWQRRTSRLQSG